MRLTGENAASAGGFPRLRAVSVSGIPSGAGTLAAAGAKNGCEKERTMKSILIRDTTREERIRIVHQALWGACGIDCEFCSGCDNRGGGRIESIYQPYIDGEKEIREINAEYNAPFVRG